MFGGNIHIKDESIAWMRFPYKLWQIVHECDSGAIQWNSEGTGILLDYVKFQSDYLDQGSEETNEDACDAFRTCNMKSFIRQLNLYNFKKRANKRSSKDSSGCELVNEFRNVFFLRGRPDLLSYIMRKTRMTRFQTQKNENETPLESFPSLEDCQKRFTEALDKAVVRKKKRMTKPEDTSYYFNKHCLEVILDEGSEALIDEFVQYDDTELLTAEFPLYLETLQLPNDENEANEQSVHYELVDTVGAEGGLDSLAQVRSEQRNSFETINSEEIAFALSVLQCDIDQNEETKENTAPNECQLGVDSGQDILTTWDDVMTRMDDTFAEDIYSMLLNGSYEQQHQAEHSQEDSGQQSGHQMKQDMEMSRERVDSGYYLVNEQFHPVSVFAPDGCCCFFDMNGQMTTAYNAQ